MRSCATHEGNRSRGATRPCERQGPLARTPAGVERNGHLVQKSLPGISLRHTQSPPSVIPLRLDNQYFALGQQGALWEGVVKSRSIRGFLPAEISDPKMEIFVVLQKA